MTAMKNPNRQSAPLDGLLGLKANSGSEIKGLNPNRPKFGQANAFAVKGPINSMAQSQRTTGGNGGKNSSVNMAGKDDDMVSEFQPPANDFYNRARQLSVWSKSEIEDFIVDGHSSEDQSESDDVSIRRLSDNDSFAGKSQSSMAGLSRGSMSSTGSKGIRNFLGGKFAKRAETLKK